MIYPISWHSELSLMMLLQYKHDPFSYLYDFIQESNMNDRISVSSPLS